MTALRPVTAALERAGLLPTPAPDAPLELTGVTTDSRRVKPGMLFCAVRGTTDDGHRFLRDAAANAGAAAALV